MAADGFFVACDFRDRAERRTSTMPRDAARARRTRRAPTEVLELVQRTLASSASSLMDRTPRALRASTSRAYAGGGTRVARIGGEREHIGPTRRRPPRSRRTPVAHAVVHRRPRASTRIYDESSASPPRASGSRPRARARFHRFAPPSRSRWKNFAFVCVLTSNPANAENAARRVSTTRRASTRFGRGSNGARENPSWSTSIASARVSFRSFHAANAILGPPPTRRRRPRRRRAPPPRTSRRRR